MYHHGHPKSFCIRDACVYSEGKRALLPGHLCGTCEWNGSYDTEDRWAGQFGFVLVACPSRLLSQLINRQSLLTVDVDANDEGDGDGDEGEGNNDDSSRVSDNNIVEDSEFMVDRRLYCVRDYVPGVHFRAECI